ncbi:MAG: glycoside hydrolase family 27 protein [Ignavibacteriales bacterium]|nr:glycoside hydrolase family 27 protein [Ignavibacteriales bacterium]
MKNKILASTPPMGWNSWDCFGTSVTEDEVKANAEYMAANLLKHGWEYIVIDIQWSEPNAKAHGYRKFAKLEMDKYGRLIPAVNRFPSSADGKGFKPLAEYIHNLGLKLGIHIMRGIPRQAVKENLLIKNTEYHAQDIADTNSVCPWNTDMYGVRSDTPGGQAYYNSIIELYEEWGVDYIKADDMTALNGKPADENRLNDIKMLSNAIKNNIRPIVLSLSPGPAGISQADFLEEHAQLWRISDDFWDKWSDILQMFDYMRTWQKHIGPNTWPDADMLPIGKIGIRAERGENRFTRFTRDEQITLISLWSLFRSPLMFGGNLPDNDEFTLELITNDEVLAINQHSSNNREVYNQNGIIAWSADTKDSEEIYLGIFLIQRIQTQML